MQIVFRILMNLTSPRTKELNNIEIFSDPLNSISSLASLVASRPSVCVNTLLLITEQTLQLNNIYTSHNNNFSSVFINHNKTS
jgi:hypothetical protein